MRAGGRTLVFFFSFGALPYYYLVYVDEMYPFFVRALKSIAAPLERPVMRDP